MSSAKIQIRDSSDFFFLFLADTLSKTLYVSVNYVKTFFYLKNKWKNRRNLSRSESVLPENLRRGPSSDAIFRP